MTGLTLLHLDRPEAHARRDPNHKPFYRTLPFKLSVCAVLFLIAFLMKGEVITTATFLARVLDSAGDVFADMVVKGE